MNWVLIIIVAIVGELVIRFFTRHMEDKRKREKVLASLWLVLGVILVVVWLLTK